MRTELNYENAIYWASHQHNLLKQQTALEVRITVLEYEMDRREKDVMVAVTSEREDGRSKFSNELARKAETAHRLSLDPEYQRLRAEAGILNRESLHLQREAKFAGRIVEIMCTFARKEQEPIIPVPVSVLAMIGRRNAAAEESIKIPSFDELAAWDTEGFPAA